MSDLKQFFEYGALRMLSKVFPKTFERAFEAAQQNRLTSDWNAFSKTLNSDIRADLPLLQKRSMDLWENDPYAKKIIGMIGKNAVGPQGFTLRNRAMKPGKDEDGTPNLILDREMNLYIQNKWKEFNRKENYTNKKDLTGREALKIMIQQIAIDGEVFKIHILNKNANNKFGYTQQFIESQRCDVRYNGVSKEGRPIVMGIEYDEYARPVKYYFKKEDVSRDSMGYNYSTEYEEIPAERVEHLFVRETFNQLRGIPWLAPNLLRLKMLKGFEDASLVNARASAMTTNIWEPIQPTGQQSLTQSNVAGSSSDADGNLVQNLQPGQTHIVPKGYTFKTHNPAFPHTQHRDFKNAMLQSVASGSEISFIKLANTYEMANYTSTRGSFLDEQELWKELHTWIKDHDLNITFEMFLKYGILNGAIEIKITDYEKVNQPNFQGRTWALLNPVDETKANYDAYLSRQKTLSEILNELGKDFEDTIDQFAYEQEYMKKKGVSIDKIGSGTTSPKDDENNITKGNEDENKTANLKRAI